MFEHCQQAGPLEQKCWRGTLSRKNTIFKLTGPLKKSLLIFAGCGLCFSPLPLTVIIILVFPTFDFKS